jgi:hypothetical protein
LKYFEEVFTCKINADRNLCVESKTHCVVAGKKMDFFYKFKLSHATDLNVKILQNHILKDESANPICLPVRYVIGRKSLVSKKSKLYLDRLTKFNDKDQDGNKRNESRKSKDFTGEKMGSQQSNEIQSNSAGSDPKVTINLQKFGYVLGTQFSSQQIGLNADSNLTPSMGRPTMGR